MKYTLIRCSLDNLLLDPNNYRFLDFEDYQEVATTTYHEPRVQDKAYQRLKGSRYEDLQALKESILANKYVPLDSLVVRAYEHVSDKFVVIEGNRRLAAMRWILEDKNSGVAIPLGVIESFVELDVVLIDPKDPENAEAIQVIMGVRHVAGVREWAAYQQAKLICELVDDFKMPLKDAAAKISMMPQEAMRRRRAFKALQQMRDDDEFGAEADPELYYKFQSAVGITAVKNWLGWSENDLAFQNEDATRQFYALIVGGRDPETNRDVAPKLRTRDEVAGLKDILPNEEAKSILLDPSRTLPEAIAVVMASKVGGWTNPVKTALKAIGKIPAKDIKKIELADIQLIKDLKDALDELLADIEKLK